MADIGKPAAPSDVPSGSSNVSELRVRLSFEGAEQARLDAIQASADRLLRAMMAPPGPNCVWGLAESIWPALLLREHREKPPTAVQLVLLPLSRIGQMEGKSGSLVLIGYLTDANNERLPRSHPVVIKTLPKDENKLRDEFDCAESVKPFVYDQKDVFAIPFRFDAENENFHVLWSIFSASAALWPDDRSTPIPKGRDLRNLIKEDDEKLRLPMEDSSRDDRPILKAMDEVFHTLKSLHMPFGKNHCEERIVGTEYAWYLRGYGRGWGIEWQEVWGPPNKELVQIYGRELRNPLWVVDQLAKATGKFTIGAVHGDLHLGNVVLSPANRPRVIDFGWASDQSHIAKDYVLFECNLRFLMLRPQLSEDDLFEFTNWIAWDAERPKLGEYSARRADLIIRLRALAKQAFPPDANWDWEYIVPLFLVGFGLLRFAPLLGNQLAALRTVVSLAQHVAKLLPDAHPRPASS